MDLSDEIAVRRVAAHAVLLGIGPAHAAPDIAIYVGTHTIGEAGCEALGEHFSVGELVAVDVEHTHVRTAAMGKAAVDDVKLFLVRREGKPVGLIEVISYNGRLPALRIEPIDPRRQFRLRQMTFVVAEDAVAGIREPDGAVRRDYHVVGRIELLALEAVDQDRDGAVGFRARDAPCIVLAGDESTFAVAGIAV